MEGIITLYVFLGIVAICIHAYIASEFKSIAEDKGYYETKYFWIPFLFGIAGYIMVAALRDRNYKIILEKEDKKIEKEKKEEELPEL